MGGAGRPRGDHPGGRRRRGQGPPHPGEPGCADSVAAAVAEVSARQAAGMPRKGIAAVAAERACPNERYTTPWWRPSGPDNMPERLVRTARLVRMSPHRHILAALAWPYANGPRHIGHVAGFGVPSDMFTRYQRMAGNKVLMVSGTDEHGTRSRCRPTRRA